MNYYKTMDSIRIDGIDIPCDKFTTNEIILKHKLQVLYDDKKLGESFVKLNYIYSEVSEMYLLSNETSLDNIYSEYHFSHNYKIFYDYDQGGLLPFVSNVPIEIDYLPTNIKLSGDEEWYRYYKSRLREEKINKLFY